MSKRRYITILLLLLSLTAVAQRKTISGYVMDADSKETLIGATIVDRTSGRGCVTNSYGFYTITLQQGPVDLQVAFVGFDAQQHRFELVNDTTLSFMLQTNNTLEEVVIQATASTINARTPQMSVVELPVQQIKSIPTLFGEADVLKALQLLPGVQNGTEGGAGLYVRGGGPDQNLLLLDGVPVYNVNHALGFFSVFNPDALKNVTLYKGSFPAHFGGRLSSVIDVRMKEGDMQHYRGNFSIGLISSKINVEGPIVKDKLSFNFSFRRTYSDILMRPALWIVRRNLVDADKFKFGYYFYDLNGKVNWKISDKDRLYLSLYSGDDKMYVDIKVRNNMTTYDNDYHFLEEEDLSWRWGNKVAALRWNHVMSNQLFMDASVNYTQYRHRLGVTYAQEYTYDNPPTTNRDEMDMGLKSGINDLTAKVDFDYSPVPTHEIRFGGNVTQHWFRPESQSIHYSMADEYAYSFDTITGSPVIHANETALYAEDNITLSEVFRVNAGLHYSTFYVQNKFYHSLQPRLGMSLMLSPNLSIKAGYAYMSQYVHLLSNSSLSLPTDIWVPVTAKVEPMKAHQISAGAFYEIPELFDISIEGYYKTMDNLLEYKDGTFLFGSTEHWDDKICVGRGWSYGVELLLQRSFGKTTGWFGYTWGHAKRKFDREGQIINDGEVFPAKYDRRHDISITAQHKFNDKYDVAATWVYSSGNCGTLGLQTYNGFDDMWGYHTTLADIHRNNYRLGSYHRLDLSFNVHFQAPDGIHTLNLSIYNAYCHNNPFLVYRDYVYDEETQESKRALMQVSIFPIIPTFSYSFKF